MGNPGISLTCTVLSRTTWDTVSRSCAAMPGFPRPRVNFLSLILANAVRRRSGPGSVPPSDATAPAASGRIGHRARPRRGTLGRISRTTRLVGHNRSRSRDQLPSAITNRVPSCRAAPLPSDSPSIPRGGTVSSSLLPSLEACADLCYAPLLPEIDATRGNWHTSASRSRYGDDRACEMKSHFPAYFPRGGEIDGGVARAREILQRRRDSPERRAKARGTLRGLRGTSFTSGDLLIDKLPLSTNSCRQLSRCFRRESYR